MRLQSRSCPRAAVISRVGNICLQAHHGRLLAGGLRCLPPGHLHRLLIPWQLVSPRGRMEVAHTVNYGLVSDSYTQFLFFLLEVSHWVQPIFNPRKGVTPGRERQEVTLESGYCSPFKDTNFVSYPVTQEILKICLNYFHYRNFSSPSIHLQQSFVDLSQPKYRRPVEGLIQNFISTTTTIHCDGELQVRVGRKQNHSAELQEINVLASVQFPLDTCPCHRKKY